MYVWVVIAGSFVGYILAGYIHDALGRRPHLRRRRADPALHDPLLRLADQIHDARLVQLRERRPVCGDRHHALKPSFDMLDLSEGTHTTAMAAPPGRHYFEFRSQDNATLRLTVEGRS
jgi:hypothetical protein